ncbi:Corticosteroid-binding protein like [Verticillium longisporum]|nr:Corticosteroid-binding protein like [Verticillium longisporum]
MCPPTNRPADDGPPIRVAIIGTGLAGLTTAHLLQNDDKNRYEVTLFEQANGLSFDAASVAVRNEVTRHYQQRKHEHGYEKDAAPAARKRVIIVGAGIAGLRAAAVLLEKDIDVVVVEARDRIGGRMLTAEVGKDKLDMGAAWMHGTCPLHFAEFGPPGSQFKAGNVADEFLDYLSYWLQREPDAPDVTADEHIRKFVRQHELLTEGEHVWAPEALRLHEATLGLRVEDISSKFFLDMLPPERDLYVKGGYRRIVEHPHGRHQMF